MTGKVALVLSGGGARAAYQAGVLRGISKILRNEKSPFSIITGLSAGAINGLWLASDADDFPAGTQKMWNLWNDIHTTQVFKTDAPSLLMQGLNWLEAFTTGGLFRKPDPTFLFNTAPLAEFLRTHIDFPAVNRHLASGLLQGVSVTATNYHTGRAVSFFTGDKRIQPWHTTSHHGQRADIGLEHVMASSALPIFFPPQRIGDNDYGDGGIRLRSPLSPAIRLGAERILAIGIQNPVTTNSVSSMAHYRKATIGDVSGTLLDAMLFASMQEDIARCENLNRLVEKFPKVKPFREVPLLAIFPSRDLGAMGRKQLSHFPLPVRHVMRGFGISNAKSWDLMSYLAFNHDYAKVLLKLGHADALERRREILEFFKESV